jgi:hypothetical protein
LDARYGPIRRQEQKGTANADKQEQSKPGTGTGRKIPKLTGTNTVPFDWKKASFFPTVFSLSLSSQKRLVSLLLFFSPARRNKALVVVGSSASATVDAVVGRDGNGEFPVGF